MSDTIDINVYETIEDVTINVTQEVVQVNINRVTSTGAVNSVNGQTGDVVLDIPTKTSELENDSDFVTSIELDNYVPYTGATQDVDLGERVINSKFILIQNKARLEARNVTENVIIDFQDKNYTVAGLDDIPDTTNLVPYTGATQDVDLGEYKIKAGQFELDQTPTQAFNVGCMRWNDADGTAELLLKGGNVTLQIGQEQLVRVVNKVGVNLLESNYQAVKITGAQGQRLKINLAQANNDLNSAETIGLVTENINNNQEGFVTTSGLVRGINTTGSLQGETWLDGDVLYLSPTTAGKLTNIKPTAPSHLVIIGYVVYAHANNGQIFVKVDNGYELEELHNVTNTDYPTPIDTDSLLTYDVTNSLWKRLIWSNIKASLKAYFDTIYTTTLAVTSQINSALASFKTTNFLDATSSIQTQLDSKLNKGLNLKITTPSSYVTGTLTETEVLKIEIPANTLWASDAIKIPLALFKKLNTNGNWTIRFKMSTSATMPSGSTDQIAISPAATAANMTIGMIKTYFIEGGNIKGTQFTAASYTDNNASAGAISEKPFDRMVTNYFYVSIQLGSISDQARLEAMQINNL